MAIFKAILYTFAIFTLLYYAHKKRDSRTLFNVIMVLCWIVIALSLDSNDVFNYRRAYDREVYRGKDFLFDLFQYVFFNLHIPFDLFKILYATVIWFLLYRAIQYFTVDIALAAAIFVFGPMMGFGTQMRSSMAGAIVITAIPILLKKDGKVWQYCALVALACTFHMMAAFYFIFVIPKYIRISAKRLRNYVCLFALALIPFLLLFAVPISKLLTFMTTWTNISAVNTILGRLAQYFSGEMGPNIKGFLFVSCGHFVVFFATERMCSAMLSLRNDPKFRKNRKFRLSAYAISYLRKLNSIMVLMIPCYILSLQFDRFNGYFVPIGYCLIVQGVKELKMARKDGHFLRLRKRRGQRNLLPMLFDLPLMRKGHFELALLVACLIFCFFVNNRFNATSEFVRIVNGIAMFGGAK